MSKFTKWADMSEDERAAAKERRENEIARLRELLVEGAAKVEGAGGYVEWLDTAMNFYHYSANNQMLIGLQTGWTATLVASFKQWKKYGRKVRKGEKAIKILAPINVRYWRDDEGNRYGAREDHPADAEEINFMAFKAVPVFDIAQTEGEPLEVVRRRVYAERGGGWPLLDSMDDRGVYEALTRLAAHYGIPVEETLIRGTARGRTVAEMHMSLDGETKRKLRIEIDRHMSLADKAKTMAHEIGHVVCGHLGERDGIVCRELKELEAESVAYIIAGMFGLDSGDQSFSYVARWSDFDTSKIAGVQDAVTRAVRQIMDDLAMVTGAGVAMAA